MEEPAPAALTLMMGDETDRRSRSTPRSATSATCYLFFDVTKAPFDNMMVRQAFSHAIDRDAIKSHPRPGRHAGLLLARAGLPGLAARGAAGHPEVRPGRWPSISSPTPASRTARISRSRPCGCARRVRSTRRSHGALAAMLKENLNIEVELEEQDSAGLHGQPDRQADQDPVRLRSLRHGLPRSVQHALRLALGRPPLLVEPGLRRRLKEASAFLGAPTSGSRCSRTPSRSWSTTCRRSSSTTAPGSSSSSRGSRATSGAGQERHHQHALAGLHHDGTVPEELYWRRRAGPRLIERLWSLVFGLSWWNRRGSESLPPRFPSAVTRERDGTRGLL